MYHLLLSFKFEKLYGLRQKKRDFLHTINDINVKTKAQISCVVIAELIHSFLVGYIAALERLKITPLTSNEKRGGHFFSAVLGQIVFILAGNNNIH